MRVDLHVHTSHSNRPTNFFLRRLNVPESLTAPREAYALAKRRGMDFVTFTDSDTIAGCLELAEHADVFTSCATTLTFPEDECKIRIIICGLNEQQLQHLLAYRGHIYNVRDFLLAENLYHAVVAPLDILNNRLAPDHIEKLLLLFDHFELRSGARQQRTSDFLGILFDRLTPELLHHLQKKWTIQPAGPQPWQKGVIGGSDDYCGQYVGLTWTEVVAPCSTPREFLEQLAQKSGVPGGSCGTTVTCAHSQYRIAAAYYQKNLRNRSANESDLIGMVLERALQPGYKPLSIAERLQLGAHQLKRWLSRRRRPSAIERRLRREFLLAYAQIPPEQKLDNLHPDQVAEFDERLNALVDRIISRVTYRLFSFAAREFAQGHIGNALAYGAAILPLQATLAPYVFSYKKLNRDRKLITEIKQRFQTYIDFPARNDRKKVAWFSDTVTDVNGVAMTLHKLAEVAQQSGDDLTILCSVHPERAPTHPRFKNFEPVGEVALPDYELQKLAMPPGLKILRYLEAENFDEYVISTPGPVGLLALAAANLFQVPCRAIYHSDFPQHVRHITGDESLEQLTWSAMRAFYLRADAVYSPSAYYREQLVEHGFPREKLRLFHRGTDRDAFNPRHHDPHFFARYNAQNKIVFLYTGRISKEKNLDLLCEAFVSDPVLLEHAALALVGDGPHKHSLAERFAHPAIIFPGFLKDKVLARAYASAAVFVFPSTTDTYGNAVLEAQASGLPALVSDEGGPREIISPDNSGFVLPGYDREAWRAAMRKLADNSDLRNRMSAAARAHTANRDWATAFREFWEENPYSARPKNLRAGKHTDVPKF